MPPMNSNVFCIRTSLPAVYEIQYLRVKKEIRFLGGNTYKNHLKLELMKLNRLKRKGKTPFTTEDARKEGVTPHLLYHYVKKGLLARVSHGVYAFPESQGTDLESLISEKLAAIPQGVIGLKTALRLHGLSEELPGEIEIIVPDNNVPKRKLEDVKLYPVSSHLLRIDVKTKRGIPVTSLERTLIDLLRSGEPMSFVLEVIKEARSKRKEVSFPKLKKLGDKLRAKARVERLLEALL